MSTLNELVIEEMRGDLKEIKEQLSFLIRLEEREKVRDKRISLLENAVDDCKKSNVTFQTSQNTMDIKSLQTKLWLAIWTSLVAATAAIYTNLKG